MSGNVLLDVTYDYRSMSKFVYDAMTIYGGDWPGYYDCTKMGHIEICDVCISSIMYHFEVYPGIYFHLNIADVEELIR